MNYRDVDFVSYQVATRDTAIYPDAQQGTVMAVAYCALGLGETGEVQGKVKKILRDNNGEITSEAVAAIRGELGDVLWYVARLCDELGLNMREVAHDNLMKLDARKERGVLQGSGDNR